MKNLAILIIYLLSTCASYAQRWSSAFVGKPESRALYASNVAKAIQNAWENELLSKNKNEMLLDEIIFGQESESKTSPKAEVNKLIVSNIDEIGEILGIKEEGELDPVKKKKVENPTGALPPKGSPKVGTENVSLIGIVNDEKEIGKVSNTTTTLTINNDEIDTDSVYSIPQVSPMFPGGQNAMKNFFAKNIITPDNDGIRLKGKVFVRFMVKKNGELSKIYLVKGLNDACNKEAIRVIKKMPSWIPAMQEGEEVNAWHTLPIYFEIE